MKKYSNGIDQVYTGEKRLQKNIYIYHNQKMKKKTQEI